MKSSSRRIVLLLALIELIIVASIATFRLKLWKIDFRVPFNYGGDTLWNLLKIKAMLLNGWIFNISQLSAPYFLSLAAHPSIKTTDGLILKGITLFTQEPGVVLNLFWLFSIVLTAWLATLALCLLGMRKWLALGIGVLYAFLPYAFLRNTAHISLVYYNVPLLCLYAVYLAGGCNYSRARMICVAGYAAAVAQGFDYIYYSFFAVVLFIFAGLLGSIRIKSWKPARAAAVAVAIIVSCTAMNLLPSFISWHTYGKPPNLEFKVSQEAEVYGLKIRKMIAPQENNVVPPFSFWGKNDIAANFPNENENTSARLGPFAALGLVLLLAVSLGIIRTEKTKEIDITKTLASLTLFTLLFSTVGGFGAVFNLIATDIRAYNRFSVFIAFFAVAGLGLWLQTWIQACTNSHKRLILIIGVVCCFLFSLYDQLLDAKALNSRRKADEATANLDKSFVIKLEEALPPGTKIFQLPVTDFPPDTGKERMLTYDHARPFIWSKHLCWSWPTFSLRDRTWLAQVDTTDYDKLPEFLVLSGFGAVWVDRFGYKDNGESVIAGLLAAGARELLSGVNARYVVLDLRPLKDNLQKKIGPIIFLQRQKEILGVPILDWLKGVYDLEQAPNGKTFRWSQADSFAEIRNTRGAQQRVTLSFLVGTYKNGIIKIAVGSQVNTFAVNSGETPIALSLTMGPGSTQKIHFSGNMKLVNPPGETRDLHFYLKDVKLKIQPLITLRT